MMARGASGGGAELRVAAHAAPRVQLRLVRRDRVLVAGLRRKRRDGGMASWLEPARVSPRRSLWPLLWLTRSARGAGKIDAGPKIVLDEISVTPLSEWRLAPGIPLSHAVALLCARFRVAGAFDAVGGAENSAARLSRERNTACYEIGMNAPVEISGARVPATYRVPLSASLLWVREELSAGVEPAGVEPEAAELEPAELEPAELEPAGVEPEAVSDWCEVHRSLQRLGCERAAHERDVCRWLLAAERLATHSFAGYASLAEYACRTLGLGARQTEERLRVGRALTGLPRLDEALAQGALHFSAVRELTRIAAPETEQAWVDWARGRASREIERAVAGRQPGDSPDDRPDPSRVRHRLGFEVRPETLAMFHDLQATVCRDLDAEGVVDLDDDTLLYEIARRALAGPGDEGRASYQVAVTRCDACGQASIDAGGETHAVDAAVSEMARCDEQHVGTVCGAPTRAHVGADPTATAAKPSSPERATQTIPPAKPSSPERATQTIPPAKRRQVVRRDRRRCRAPGCCNHRFLDLHHLVLRSEGGLHDTEQMLVLCGAHHREVHAGRLCVDGSASDGFSFRHADGTPYGQRLDPTRLDIAQQAFAALVNMSFKQREARALVDAVTHAGAPDDLEAFLRAALRAV